MICCIAACLQYCCPFGFCDVSSCTTTSATDESPPGTPTFSKLIGSEDVPGAPGFADPYVFCEDGKWYTTSTYTANRPMYMASTPDFKTIDRHKLSIDLNQDYLRKYFDAPRLVVRDIWGFVPYKHTDGSWHGYASIHIGGYKTFICHFSPNTDKSWPITDWQLDKIIVAGRSKSAYESKVYSDNTGLYLIYVETLADGNNHIMAQKLLDPEMIDNSFKARAILSPEGLHSEDRNQSGSMQIVEGPNISHVVTPEGSKYVMFYAVGDFAQNNYKLGAAYSDVLIPPQGEQYRKPKVMDKPNVWSNPAPKKEVVYILQTQVPGWFNYTETIKGPGLGNLIKYRDNYYAVFHSLERRRGGGRWVWICPVTIDFTKSMDMWLVPNLAQNGKG